MIFKNWETVERRNDCGQMDDEFEDPAYCTPSSTRTTLYNKRHLYYFKPVASNSAHNLIVHTHI